jgi:hypothetical protein
MGWIDGLEQKPTARSYDTGMNLLGFHELQGISQLDGHEPPYQEVLGSAKLVQQLM